MRTLSLTVVVVALLGVAMATDRKVDILKRLMAALEAVEEEQTLEKRGGFQYMKWDKATRTVSVYLVSTTDCRKTKTCVFLAFFTGPKNVSLSKNITLIWNTDTDVDGKRTFMLNDDGTFEGVKKGKSSSEAPGRRPNMIDMPGFVTIHVCRLKDEESPKETDCNLKIFDTSKATDDGRSSKYYK